MSISIFDLFSVGIGPSSSHTVGPMRAALQFVESLDKQQLLTQVAQLKITLYGSLAWTGIGHGTDGAIIMGLLGETPEHIDPDLIQVTLQDLKTKPSLELLGKQLINFDISHDLIFNKHENLDFHANGMRFQAFAADGAELDNKVLYSVGGGFVVDETVDQEHESLSTHQERVAYDFNDYAKLEQHCLNNKLSIADIVLANEATWHSQEAIEEQLTAIWQVMAESIHNGCHNEGILPGGLQVKRRAPEIFKKLCNRKETQGLQKVSSMDWVSCYAIAVNEENAAGRRVVTAPTNGAAGVIPAVLNYYLQTFANDEKIIAKYLLTAGAIGILYKKGASISAAEVGCQGEVGVACSMAAAGLAAIMGGSLKQIENAAEIGMEHHLGLTCDPVQGLVQIPCIERNAMGAVQAINAARLALLEEGSQSKVSLDNVIKTMRDTGKDMSAKYKETALGGLAKNLPEC